MNKSFESRQSGFTLMDVIVGVSTIGLLLAIVLPEVNKISQQLELKAAARELYAHFQFAKLEAVKRNENVLITFDEHNNSYSVFVDSLPTQSPNRSLDDGETVLAEKQLRAPLTLRSVSFGGTTVGGFTPKGRPSGGTGRVIIRDNETKKEFKLTTSIAGYVHLK